MLGQQFYQYGIRLSGRGSEYGQRRRERCLVLAHLRQSFAHMFAAACVRDHGSGVENQMHRLHAVRRGTPRRSRSAAKYSGVWRACDSASRSPARSTPVRLSVTPRSSTNVSWSASLACPDSLRPTGFTVQAFEQNSLPVPLEPERKCGATPSGGAAVAVEVPGIERGFLVALAGLLSEQLAMPLLGASDHS